jgi:putative transposase
VAHHVTRRGNNRQDVFFVADDRRVYLEILRQQATRWGVRVLGYCLMTNHVHLVAAPGRKESLARAVGRIDFLYTQYINRLHRRSGHLWQNRFYSCAVAGADLWAALAYVDRNPVRARLVRLAWKYRWSSASAHLGQADPAGLISAGEWERLAAGIDYRALLARPEDMEVLCRLRTSTHTGRPLASDAFLAKVERAVGRRLRPLSVGRPPKPRREGRNR